MMNKETGHAGPPEVRTVTFKLGVTKKARNGEKQPGLKCDNRHFGRGGVKRFWGMQSLNFWSGQGSLRAAALPSLSFNGS